MGTIYLIHGAYGNPAENWLPWLAGKLETEGHEVIVPRFPTPERQSLQNWLEVFREHLNHLDHTSLMVGHSLGPVFIANILNKYDVHIRGAVFVAGFGSRLGNPDFDEINKTFVDEPLDNKKVRSRCDEFIAYVSENDPYVPLTISLSFAQDLGARTVRVPDAGHFNASAGYTEFPAVLDDCISLLGHKRR